jgi:hypothetical protein
MENISSKKELLETVFSRESVVRTTEHARSLPENRDEDAAKTKDSQAETVKVFENTEDDCSTDTI